MMEKANTATAASAEVDPWQLAKDRYLQGLDSEERALFDEATIENLYYKTCNEARDERKRKTSCAIRKLQPLVAALKDYGEALDVYSNISPLPLAPIWGSIRVLLVLAEKYDKYYNRIVDILERIGDLLPRFRDYGRIFDSKKYPRLSQALSETYLDIINICMEFREILQSQTRVSLKRLSRPLLLDVQYEDALERFRNHRKAVVKEAEVCHMIEAAEGSALVLRNKELQELKEKAERRRALLAQLSAINPESRHKKLRASRHGNTGAWLKKEPGYLAWLECDTTSLLCCYGIPGCGKSVLASGIIDALTASSRSHILAYYFCDYVDKRTLDVVAILSTIARQLLEKKEIPSPIEMLITQNFGDQRTPDWRGAFDVFVAVIRLFPAITIILDGIDEMDEENRKALLSALKRIGDDRTLHFKLLISCREDATQSLKFPAATSFRVHIQPLNLALDIEAYISHTVGFLLESGDLVIQDPTLKGIIIDKLIGGAQGMFLWVKFQLDDVCNAESDAEIKRVLNNLPKDLSETYARLLGRITGPQRQVLAKRMFQWIICARRPLHVEELREAIAFTIEDQFFDREKLPTDMPRLIRGCGNLVVIDEGTQEVYLAHYTVQQYILSEEGTSQDSGQDYHFTLKEVNEAIGEVCIAYLSFSDFERQVSKEINKPMIEITAFQRAAATGTVGNLGLVGKTMRQAISFVHKSNASANLDSLDIDYQHLLPKRHPHSERLFESYRLLNYIVDNWLFHTTAFGSTSPTRREMVFAGLILEKRLPFKFRPWDTVKTQGNLDYLCLLGWALANDHVPMLRALNGRLSDGGELKPLNLLQEACLAEERFCLGYRIRKERMAILNSLAQITVVGPEDNARIAWLYSKLILACRHGNILALCYCLDIGSLNVWYIKHLTAISHMLCEAVAYGHLKLVKWIIHKYLQTSNRGLRLAKCNYLVNGYDYYFNAMEIALLRGYSSIAAIFQNEIRDKVHIDRLLYIIEGRMEDIMQNTAAVDAILEVVAPTIDNLANAANGRVLHLLHYTALSQAARNGDTARISRYIRHFNLEKHVGPRLTPLQNAMLDDNTALIRALVNFGADTQTVLLSTRLQKRPGLIKRLVDIGLDGEVLFKLLEANMDIAIKNMAVFDSILEVLNPITAEQDQILRILLYKAISEAARSGDAAQVERYLNRFDVNKPISPSQAPLFSAISNENPALINALVRAGAFTGEGHLQALEWDFERIEL